MIPNRAANEPPTNERTGPNAGTTIAKNKIAIIQIVRLATRCQQNSKLNNKTKLKVVQFKSGEFMF